MTGEKGYFEKVFSRGDYEFSFEADEEVLNKVLKYINKGDALDLGCGEGVMLYT
jgi:16S rRNA G1207 methylase RsmC